MQCGYKSQIASGPGCKFLFIEYNANIKNTVNGRQQYLLGSLTCMAQLQLCPIHTYDTADFLQITHNA